MKENDKTEVKKTIPLFAVHVPKDVDAPLLEVLHSGYIGQGKKVDEFEKILGDYIGNKNVLTLNSATSGLHLALRLSNVGYGDEVISTAMTCTATNMPIIANGAKIVWADIDSQTGLIDPLDIERKITNKTKAIIIVDWGGTPCDLDAIMAIGKKYKVKVIEDCAHSFGAKYKGRKIGTICDFSVFSFQAIKHITTVDGGALFCLNTDDYKRGKLLRWYGIDREGERKDFRCLHPNTLIKFHDGSTERIANVVNNKIDKPIFVYDNGKLVLSKIKKWVKSELGNRHFYSITTDRLDKKYGCILTNDHKILTEKRGWVTVDELKNNEKILTSFPKANKNQEQLLIGSLLGDGHIRSRTNAKTAVYSEGHSPKQKEYLELKAKVLNSLNAKVIYVKPNKSQKIPYGKYSLYTKTNPYLGEIRELFYNNSKKHIPRKYISDNFTLFSLAVWFMDDGCTYVRNSIEGLKYESEIATNSFDKSDVEWLVKMLKKMGYYCVAKKHGKETVKNLGYRIFFNTESTNKLLKDIAKYVPESMRYKVGHRNDVDKFDEKLWTSEDALGYFDKVKKQKHYNKGYNNVYCLSVENKSSNFMTSSIIVHNCEENIIEYGYKFHMNDINATIGISQMPYADSVVGKHIENAKYYLENINKEYYHFAGFGDSSYWLFTMLLPNQEERLEFMKFMTDKGVMVSQVHARNDLHTAFKDYAINLPNVSKFVERQVSIPVHWKITEEEREYIVKCCNEFAKNKLS